MRRSRFTEEQISRVLNEGEAGANIEELGRRSAAAGLDGGQVPWLPLNTVSAVSNADSIRSRSDSSSSVFTPVRLTAFA